MFYAVSNKYVNRDTLINNQHITWRESRDGSVDLNADNLLMLEIHFSNKLKCANYSNQISKTFLLHIYLI